MAYCMKCGAQLQEGAAFCSHCGAPVMGAAKSNSDDKIMAILSYFGLLVLIPIFAAKNSAFARFHANQGLILLIVEAAWGIVQKICSSILLLIGMPLLSALLQIVNLGFLILAIMGIVYAAKGEERELPIIGQFRLLK